MDLPWWGVACDGQPAGCHRQVGAGAPERRLVPEPDAEPAPDFESEWFTDLVERAINGVELPRLRRGAGLQGPGWLVDHLAGQTVGRRLGRGSALDTRLGSSGWPVDDRRRKTAATPGSTGGEQMGSRHVRSTVLNCIQRL
jgi:hypothetical protein